MFIIYFLETCRDYFSNSCSSFATKMKPLHRDSKQCPSKQPLTKTYILKQQWSCSENESIWSYYTSVVKPSEGSQHYGSYTSCKKDQSMFPKMELFCRYCARFVFASTVQFMCRPSVSFSIWKFQKRPLEELVSKSPETAKNYLRTFFSKTAGCGIYIMQNSFSDKNVFGSRASNSFQNNTLTTNIYKNWQ